MTVAPAPLLGTPGLGARAISASSYLILLAGVATMCVAAYMVASCYTPLPWSDGWVEIFGATAVQNLRSLGWLWQQHNEHRLLIPKLFLLGDLRLFGAQQKFLLASIYTIQVLHLWLLSWSMRALSAWRGPLWRAATGLAAVALFCPTQWENLTWGFQTCFVLPPLFGTLSFVGLLFAWRNRSWRFVVLSVVAGLAATCSLANGLLLLPLLTVAAFVIRLKRAVVLAYLLSAVAGTTLFFHSYVPPAHDPGSLLRSPVKLIAYLASYFGSTWTGGSAWTRHNLQIAPWFGAAELALWIVLLFRMRTVIEERDAFSLLLKLLSAFCVGTAVLTALGRAESGNGQAFSSRYQTIALLFSWTLACLLLSATRRLNSPVTLALNVLLIAVLFRGAILLHLPLREAREHAFQQRAATAALLSGVNDRQQITEAFYLPDRVLQVVPIMRERRLSIFAEQVWPLLGMRLESAARVADEERCRGAVQSVNSFQNDASPDLRITGWAWDLEHRRSAAEMLVVENGIVVGLGAVGGWRPMLRPTHRYMTSSFTGFTAYARRVSTMGPLAIFAVLHGASHQVCRVATVDLRPNVSSSYSDAK